MSATGTRHSTDVMVRAIELRNAGWRPGEIPRILNREFGVCPSRNTIQRWLNPAYAERERLRMKQVNADRWASKWSFNLLARATPDYKVAFIRRLDEEHLAATSIAKVCRVVFDEPWSNYQVLKTLGKA